mmetsp:Transcript_100369/g.178389  ORF Transcript_100369/g.178389 Transcript_100369/m.178389 type:complete len:144 (-) Transcript_100369:60-491(-)|eukprot:CAMPEP_0197649230 /NCGR_PEP_ID=MMETSP1338-20131121/28231_1 /TAXON_ID=43686 ORGANISM="Pelagodinium beii, Strain RCC1491" /NCGR_SAMPLE_ID=MMETSP1338 /ASSEMBLY_ACC=CAM_ASM_000754 /LENGTH=143 /DNA_ID=CAMNT_0043223369 /DNA_START=70 /DNA_END=501 /DNA_ORIENTATION=-
MPLAPELKQLTIKLGAVKRTKKEYEAYLKEEVAQRAKIEEMKAKTGKSEEDEALIKKQVEILNETLTVTPDTRQRLRQYSAELGEYLVQSHKDIEIPAEAPEAGSEVALVLEARQLLKDTDQILGTETAEKEDAVEGADVGDF